MMDKTHTEEFQDLHEELAELSLRLANYFANPIVIRYKYLEEEISRLETKKRNHTEQLDLIAFKTELRHIKENPKIKNYQECLEAISRVKTKLGQTTIPILAETPEALCQHIFVDDGNTYTCLICGFINDYQDKDTRVPVKEFNPDYESRVDKDTYYLLKFINNVSSAKRLYFLIKKDNPGLSDREILTYMQAYLQKKRDIKREIGTYPSQLRRRA